MKPVSRPPVENDTSDTSWSRMTRPYARCFILLLSGATDTRRPLCLFVPRNISASFDACVVAVIVISIPLVCYVLKTRARRPFIGDYPQANPLQTSCDHRSSKRRSGYQSDGAAQARVLFGGHNPNLDRACSFSQRPLTKRGTHDGLDHVPGRR